MTIIRVGLIGYGLSGEIFHAPLIASIKNLTLARVASSSADKLARDFPHAIISADPQELISAPDIDLIVIATPNTTHHSLARQALLAGKHVVLEKPFTISVADAQDLRLLAEEKNRVLSVFHNRRWDSDFLTLRDCIESGKLGDIHTLYSSFDRFRPAIKGRWREQDLPGSGTLYDLGSHLIDQALVLFGMPQSISADLAIQRPGGAANDYFHLVLAYQSRRVILHAGSLVKMPGPRFQAHGSTGSYIKYGLDPQEDALKAGMRPGDAAWGIEPGEAHGEICFERNGETVSETLASLPGAYQTYYQKLADAILLGGPAPVSAADGLNVIRLIECAMQSSAERRVIVLE